MTSHYWMNHGSKEAIEEMDGRVNTGLLIIYAGLVLSAIVIPACFYLM